MTNPHKILLLDDDPDFHEIFSDYLDLALPGQDKNLICVTDTDQAMSALAADDFSVIFVDYRLGATNGIEFIRKCEVHHVAAPFVLLTGFDSLQALDEALAVGAMDYLPKDELKATALARVIRHAEDAQQRRLRLRAAYRQVQEAAASKASFLANMSHELRTPLNGVIGFADLIRMDPSISPQQAGKYAAYIHESGNKLLELVDGLLNISAANSQAHLAKQSFELNYLIETVCRRYSTVADARGVNFHLHLPREVIAVHSDPQAMELALRPLIDNAVKFTEPGGNVEVSVGSSNMITVVIADDGIGMDAEALRHADTPFFQVDSSLSRRYEGAGIGLTIAKGAVETLGGEMHISSVVGEGTEVVVAIPTS